MDEAMHPLTLLSFGMYGEVLPNQNGAPGITPWWRPGSTVSRAARAWSKSVLPTSSPLPPGTGLPPRIRVLLERESERRPSALEPGDERRIGEDGLLAKKRKTLMFNGYEAQVGQLYAGMDLKKFY